LKTAQASHKIKMTNPAHPISTGAAESTLTVNPSQDHVADESLVEKERNPTANGTRRRLGSGLLTIGTYMFLHGGDFLTILLLAIVWWYLLEEAHERIFLFFVVLLTFAEYFYWLPPVLARYQQEDWWDVPTIKTALLTMFIFWSIAWFSAYTGSYLDSKEQQRRLKQEQRRLDREKLFEQALQESVVQQSTSPCD
jgi:hypothetical protein